MLIWYWNECKYAYYIGVELTLDLNYYLFLGEKWEKWNVLHIAFQKLMPTRFAVIEVSQQAIWKTPLILNHLLDSSEMIFAFFCEWKSFHFIRLKWNRIRMMACVCWLLSLWSYNKLWNIRFTKCKSTCEYYSLNNIVFYDEPAHLAPTIYLFLFYFLWLLLTSWNLCISERTSNNINWH